MRNYKRVILGLFILTGVAILVIFLINGRLDYKDRPLTHKNEISSINIGYFSRAIGYAPYFIAQQKGWFEKDSILSRIEVKHTIYGDRATISDAFDSGELDVLLSAEIPAIICRAQGNDINIVEVTGYISLKWLGRSGFGEQSISDFIGRKIAYQSGTSSHFGLLTTMASANIKDSDVSLRNMKAVEAKTAFESDNVDAWVVWSPFYEQQIESGKGLPIKNSDYNYATTMSITNKLMDNSPEIVNALLKVLEHSKRWILEHPSEADSIVAQATLQTVPITHRALGNVDFSVSLNDGLIETFQEMAQFLAENKATRNGKIVNIREEMITPNKQN